MKLWKMLVQVACLVLPWPARRSVLIAMFGWQIDRSARIGLSILAVQHLKMGPLSRIGHFTFARHIAHMTLGRGVLIGNKNWISGYPVGSTHVFNNSGRTSSLQVDDEAAITHSHRIDCTDGVHIGAFTTVAGWNTQIITHAISIAEARQRCAPVEIGRYCFVGSRCIILKGAKLPDYSILGAGSVLSHAYDESHGLYSGVPATRQRALDHNAAYFTRDAGPCY